MCSPGRTRMSDVGSGQQAAKASVGFVEFEASTSVKPRRSFRSVNRTTLKPGSSTGKATIMADVEVLSSRGEPCPSKRLP